MSPQLSLILPVLNEEGFVEEVIKEVLETLTNANLNFEILAVDNGSTDRSWEILNSLEKEDRRVRAIHSDLKGWGRAIKLGWAEANGEYVAHMPSDGQITSQSVIDLYSLVTKEGVDIAKVKRVTRENLLRKVNSFFYNLLARFLFGLSLRDINGCPKMFKKKLVETFEIFSNDSFLDLELMTKASYLKLKIVEVPTFGLDRVGGKSNTSLRTVYEFVKNMIRFRFGDSLREWKSKLKK